MSRRHHQKGIAFIVAAAILPAAAGVITLTKSQSAPAQDLKAIKADYRRPAALDDVMRHYEKGGIDRPSRSPLLVQIQLSDAERHDLVVFMNTLTGTAKARSYAADAGQSIFAPDAATTSFHSVRSLAA